MGLVLVLYRVLLLSSISPEIAAARRIPVRSVGLVYLLVLALTVSLSAVTIGSVLSTALLIGPAATALRLTRHPGVAMAGAAVLAVLAVAVGVVLAYDSVQAQPHGHVWPVSFFIVALVFLAYLGSGLPRLVRAGAGRSVRSKLVFSSFMLNTWIAATVVAVVAGAIGFFCVLRGAAFVAHAVPQGAFAGAAGAALIGVNTLLGLGLFSVLGALTIGWLGRRGRHDVVTALALVSMLGLGALFLSFSVEYEPEIYGLLFGQVLGVAQDQLLPIAALGALAVVVIACVFRPLLELDRARDGPRARTPPGRAGRRLPDRGGLDHDADRARGGGAADLQPHDRARRGRPVFRRRAGEGGPALGCDRAGHGVGRDRPGLPDRVADRILRRRPGRGRVRHRAAERVAAPHARGAAGTTKMMEA